MSAPKFLVMRFKDVRQYLTDEQKQQLAAIVKAVKEARAKEGKPANEPFFVLHGQDKYAQSALEAYVETAQADIGVVKKEDGALFGLMEAVQVAQNVRETGIMSGEPRTPTAT